MLADLEKRLEEQYYSFEFSKKVKQWILDSAYTPDFGARPLKRFIQDQVETLIAEKIIKGEIDTEHKYLLDLDSKGQLIVTTK
jgi:ATP-dependent Clp protease ATP-binding subunit ClpB